MTETTNHNPIIPEYHPLWDINKWDVMAACIPAGLMMVAIIGGMIALQAGWWTP